MKRLHLAAIFIFVSAATATAQIYRVAELNVDQIIGLDKQKTVVLMPGGILEQHGPYLPSGSDTFMNAW